MSKDVGNVLASSVNDVGGVIENLTHSLFVGFPWFIFVQRWITKYGSFYMRAFILIFGGGIFLSRQLRGYMGFFLREYMMSRAEVREGDDVYWMLLSWISNQPFAKNARNFVATIQKDGRPMHARAVVHRGGEHLEEAKPEQLNYAPARGVFPFFYKGNLFFFERQWERHHPNRPDSLSISCLGRNPKSLKRLLEECREAFNKKDENKTVVYNPSLRYTEGTWVRGMARAKRNIETVVLDEEIKATILKDLSTYFDSKQQQWYAARGIPYRRGYLLHGPPGTGKSSLSMAIAGHFNLNIFVVNLNSLNLTEEHLLQLFRQLPLKCIVLMEDIDVAGLTNQRTSSESSREKAKISLSGLLNIIDGIASQEGRVLIMTTNYIHHLDGALIRPGRVDMIIQFSNADELQLIQIFEGIYKDNESSDLLGHDDASTSGVHATLESNDATIADSEKEILKIAHIEKISTLAKEFARNIPHGIFSPAEIQGCLLTWKNEPETAVEKAAEWAAGAIAAKAAVAAAQEAEEAEKGRKASKIEAQSFNRMILQTKAVNEALKEAAGLENTENPPNTGKESTSKALDTNLDSAVANTEKQLNKPSGMASSLASSGPGEPGANTKGFVNTNEDLSSKSVEKSLEDHVATAEKPVGQSTKEAPVSTSSKPVDSTES